MLSFYLQKDLCKRHEPAVGRVQEKPGAEKAADEQTQPAKTATGRRRGGCREHRSGEDGRDRGLWRFIMGRVEQGRVEQGREA